jgi:hypothetical protein
MVTVVIPSLQESMSYAFGLSYYFCLGSIDPVTGRFIELDNTAAGYVRTDLQQGGDTSFAIDFYRPPLEDKGAVLNYIDIKFPRVKGSWGTITHAACGLYINGVFNYYVWMPFDEPFTPAINSIINIRFGGALFKLN